MKAWTKRLKAQYSSSFSSYHCCQELQKWAPPAQDHDCLLPWQLCTNPSIWTQGTEPKHTPFPHWEFFTQQSWIGKSCPIKDLKKKKEKKKKELSLCLLWPLQIFSIGFGDLCDFPHPAPCLLLKDMGIWRTQAVQGGIWGAEILYGYGYCCTNIETNHQIHQILPFQSGCWNFH